MKGLIIKELYTLNMYKKNFLLMLGLALVLTFALNMGTFYLPSMMMVFFVMVSMTAFSVDENSNWNRYAITMPVSRLQIVMARYIVFFAMIVAAMLFAFLAGIAITVAQGNQATLGEHAAICGVMTLISLFVVSLITPICYKFGAEKARLAIMIIYMIPFLGAIWGMPYIIPFFEGLGSGGLVLLMASAVVLVLALFAGSGVLSSRIYAKKEF